jgi:hypothetical protein
MSTFEEMADELEKTLRVMRSAYAHRGNRLMSIWDHDIQRVEAAVKALRSIKAREDATAKRRVALEDLGALDGETME